ncbi:hypothetical protein [Azospirillum lipoferum]|nr:hypothetical protein [Azospirillum lipoferum]
MVGDCGQKGGIMLRLVTPDQVTDVRNRILASFVAKGCRSHACKLSTPGGSIAKADLLWCPEIGLWGYFPNDLFDDNRWPCWFGSSLEPADDAKVLGPSLEINLPVDPENRQAAGRTLVDDEGHFYLGHKGGLGGGRGGQMSMAEFAKRIRGFVNEPILRSENVEERVFVIGSLDAPGFLPRLRAYIKECERLRAIAKIRAQGAMDGSMLSNVVGKAANSDSGFTPENDQDGTGSGYPSDTYTIRREHGRVVNALQKTIGDQAVNGMCFDMRPDLYVLGPKGNMKILFEVKVSSSTQSWFTALGQLVVYGAGQTPPPQRVLVCPAMREDPNFGKALKQLDIAIVTYEEGNRGRFTFHGLDLVLSQIRN